MDDYDDDLVAAALLRHGRMRALDLHEGGPLFAAVRDWMHAGLDFNDTDTVMRFCDAHGSTTDAVAQLVAKARAL